MRAAPAGKLPSGFAVRTVACMAGCSHPTTVGFHAIGKAQYLFDDLQTTFDNPDPSFVPPARPLASCGIGFNGII